MKLAMSTDVLQPMHQIYPITRQEALARLCKSGFRYLDWSICAEFQEEAARKDSPLLKDDWRDFVEDYRKTAEDGGAEFIQTHCVFCNFFADNEYDQWLVSKMEQCYEITSMLDVPVTVVHPIAPPGLEYDWEGSLAANRDFFRRQADIAAKYNVKLAVENMLSNRLFDGTIFKRCCTTSDELVELVDAIDHENVGICVDIGHTHYMKESVYDAVHKCAKHLIALHLHDNDTFNDSHVPPYACNLDWESFFRALNEIHYQGNGMLEVLYACRRLPAALQDSMLRYLNHLTEFMMAQVK